eukprot:13108309-Alexandrium_andersonii.AAC.1
MPNRQHVGLSLACSCCKSRPPSSKRPHGGQWPVSRGVDELFSRRAAPVLLASCSRVPQKSHWGASGEKVWVPVRKGGA